MKLILKKRIREAAQSALDRRPVHSREVPLPLTRDYFDVLTLDNPRRPSSPLRTISRIVGSVGTGTEGAVFAGAGAFAVGPFQMMS